MIHPISGCIFCACGGGAWGQDREHYHKSLRDKHIQKFVKLWIREA